MKLTKENTALDLSKLTEGQLRFIVDMLGDFFIPNGNFKYLSSTRGQSDNTYDVYDGILHNEIIVDFDTFVSIHIFEHPSGGIIPMSQPSKSDEDLISELSSTNRRFRRCLNRIMASTKEPHTKQLIDEALEETSPRHQENDRQPFQRMQNDIISQYSDWLEKMTYEESRELTNSIIVNGIKFLNSDQQNEVISEVLRQRGNPTYEELAKCLGELVDLKNYKLYRGKTEFYESTKPILWDKARKLLARIKK